MSYVRFTPLHLCIYIIIYIQNYHGNCSFCQNNRSYYSYCYYFKIVTRFLHFENNLSGCQGVSSGQAVIVGGGSE